MAITKFKITTPTLRATLDIATFPYVLNQEYPIAQQSQMVAGIVDVGVPYDRFGFRLGNDDDVWSEECFCTINAQVLGGTPTMPFNPMNHQHYLNEIASISFIFSFDDNTDRIIFTEKVLPQYGKIVINGIDMVIGQTYFLYEFINVFWHSSYQGLLQNVVATYKFKVGNINELSSEITLNFNSSANLQGVVEMNPATTGITAVNAVGILTTA